MEKATTDLSSTTELSMNSPVDLSTELCKECRKKLNLKNEYPLAERGRKICSIIEEFTDFINENVEDVWETNSKCNQPSYQTRKCYNISFEKHGFLSKENRFSLKRDVDMFHTFKVLSLPNCLPTSATLYISANNNGYTPIRTVQVDSAGTFRFFNCPFPIFCFPFENYSVELKYEITNNTVPSMIHKGTQVCLKPQIEKKDIIIECINTKNHMTIKNKLWEKETRECYNR